ncbi:ribonuclease Y [Patescibacteria group bacterium]|nr:MAG: ribonuclease Y [Patescibacteria group bacterium]
MSVAFLGERNAFMVFIYAIAAALLGAAAGYGARQVLGKRTQDSAEAKAERILSEAKSKAAELESKAKQQQGEILLEAKNQSLKLVEDAKRTEAEIRKDLTETQRRLEKRETMFDQKLLELEDKKAGLETQEKDVAAVKESVLRIKEEETVRLQAIASLTKEEALARLMGNVEHDQKEALMARIRKLEQEGEEELERKSRNVLALAMSRFASSVSVDGTTSSVEIPSDDMKGRIIGKEGRNIKAIEHLTGTEIIVDDTPNAITVSGFSPIRRQVAKRAIEALVKDGRIQPARIEEAVNEAKKNLASDLKKAGEEALYALGIPVSSIDPKLISILGRMKYRTSYGQNALQHSIEVGQISAMIAEELGADVFTCKKGGLFHDIGKAVDHDMQGAHPEIGYNIMKKFGFTEELAYQSIAHHEDRPRTIEGAIVKAADAISGARPGARKQSIEQFIQRMEQLEATATNFDGVEKAYAIQAGREVRVFIKPETIDDLGAYKLARDIANKIEAELSYPGEVKVTVIRETRVIEFAK